MSRSKREACSLDLPLLVKGTGVVLDFDDGAFLEYPDSWGLVHDPEGSCFPRCQIYVCPYSLLSPLGDGLDPKRGRIASAYWGRKASLYEGLVEIPPGPWQRLSALVTTIYYDRQGNLAYRYKHDFKHPVPIYECQTTGSGKLALPDDCVVDAHGFVWP